MTAPEYMNDLRKVRSKVLAYTVDYQQRVLLIVTPRSFSTELTFILLSHILIS